MPDGVRRWSMQWRHAQPRILDAACGTDAFSQLGRASGCSLPVWTYRFTCVTRRSPERALDGDVALVAEDAKARAGPTVSSTRWPAVLVSSSCRCGSPRSRWRDSPALGPAEPWHSIPPSFPTARRSATPFLRFALPRAVLQGYLRDDFSFAPRV
jgi:hypothetical protein